MDGSDTSRFVNELPDKNIEKNEIFKKDDEDFDFDQDNSIQFDEGYRSPGWDRLKKKLIKWKNKEIKKIIL